MALHPPERAFWSMSAEELLTALGSTAEGLSTAEAVSRLARYGENSLAGQEQSETIRLIWRQVESPLVLILVFGALISLVLGDWVDAALILVIVAGSAVAGFLQE
jgi:Mg2+-importing ATPase